MPMRFIAFTLLVVIHSTVYAEDAILREAEEALNAQKPQAALSLLLPYADEEEGSQPFDYLISLAFLGTNQPQQAIFGLERTVLARPNFHAAKLDLAQAYLQTGQRQRAKEILVSLKALNPPPAVSRVIDQYLLATEPRLEASHQWQLALATGFDSNANQATSGDSFLGFALSEQSRESDSSFLAVRGGLAAALPLTERLAIQAQLSVGHRAHPDASFVDQTAIAGNLGLRPSKPFGYRGINVDAYRLSVDGDFNHRAVGLNSGYRFALPQKWSLQLDARVGTVRYEVDQSVRDVDQFYFLPELRKAQDDASYAIGIFVGSDNAVRPSSRYDRSRFGVSGSYRRVVGQWLLDSHLRWVRSDFDEVFFAAAVDQPRQDDQLSLGIGLKSKWGKQWFFEPRWSYVKNDSNVSLFSYDRHEISLQLSRNWTK